MKIMLAATSLIAVVAISCAPGNKGGSFSAVPGTGERVEIQTGHGSSPDPALTAPSPGEQDSPQVHPGELFPSDPGFGDENPGDFFIKPKNHAIHI